MDPLDEKDLTHPSRWLARFAEVKQELLDMRLPALREMAEVTPGVYKLSLQIHQVPLEAFEAEAATPEADEVVYWGTKANPTMLNRKYRSVHLTWKVGAVSVDVVLFSEYEGPVDPGGYRESEVAGDGE